MKELYSTSYQYPDVEPTSSYLSTVKTSDNGVHSYTTYREMDTGESKDYVIECGKIHKFAWVGSSLTSEFAKHNKIGQF